MARAPTPNSQQPKNRRRHRAGQGYFLQAPHPWRERERPVIDVALINLAPHAQVHLHKRSRRTHEASTIRAIFYALWRHGLGQAQVRVTLFHHTWSYFAATWHLNNW